MATSRFFAINSQQEHCTIECNIFQVFFSSFPYFFHFREIREKVTKLPPFLCAGCTILLDNPGKNLPGRILFSFSFPTQPLFTGACGKCGAFLLYNNRFRRGTITRWRRKAGIWLYGWSVKWIVVLDLGVQKRPVDVSSKKGMRALSDKQACPVVPRIPFLKALTRFLNIPNHLHCSRHTGLLPYSHFHRRLKQIAAPAGTCYLRKHPAFPEPAGKVLNAGYRKEK